MKVFFCSELKNSPWGGGNQFQLALKREFFARGKTVESLAEADFAILNSHHLMVDEAQLISWKKSGGKVVHRVDGPLSQTRGVWKGQLTDWKIFGLNRRLADATVFQTEWSKRKNLAQYPFFATPYRVIGNAASDFFQPNHTVRGEHQRVSIVTTSWSSNRRKGFDTLSFLDSNLDFSRFRVTFIGNSPTVFNNLEVIEPLGSKELAQELRKHRIFLSPSRNDPCSNSLIEGIASGLIPLARNSGGHPEIVGTAELLFSSNRQLLSMLDSVSTRLARLGATRPPVKSITEIANEYEDFFTSL